MADPVRDDNRAMMRLGVQAINSLNDTLGKVIPAIQSTSTSATAGAAMLPSNPVGFIDSTLPDGTPIRIPYYAP